MSTVTNNCECVVSGISGRFPNTESVDELWTALIHGQSLTTTDTEMWPFGLYGLKSKFGVVKNLNKLDADYFNLNGHIYADPESRISYEVIYESIWDAGVNPDELRETRTGLLIGQWVDDTHSMFPSSDRGFPRNRVESIAANFGFLGPALEIDSACASSFSALNEAVLMIRKSVCNTAVIIGNNIVLHPSNILNGLALGTLSVDGVCKSLDAKANGYCRSDAIVACFIQKKSEAKRIYASILSCSSNNDGYKEMGILYPKTETQALAMKEAIRQANVNPLDIEYIEGHITGTSSGDPVECKSILTAFRGDNKKPILVGCLKPNIGHTESAAGVCALIKAMKIFQNEIIPRSINMKELNPNIEGLVNGRILPVLKNTPFHGDIIAVNAMGFGVSNACVILKRNEKSTNDESFNIAGKIPRLINICGRTEESVNRTMDWININKKKVTKDFLSLLNDVSKTPFETGMIYRGFMVIDNNWNIFEKRITTQTTKQEIYFLFPSYNGNLPAFNKELMALKPFAESLQESKIASKELGIDLNEIIINSKTHLNNYNECAIAFASIQIAFYDTLNCLKIKPNKCIGHSNGASVALFTSGQLSRKQLFELLIEETKHEQKSCLSLNDRFENAIFVEFNSNEKIDLQRNQINIDCSQNINEILAAIGDLYLCGHNPEIEKLYPKIEYPVARQTVSLSPLLKWNHTKDFYVCKYLRDSNHSIQVNEEINLKTDEYRFLLGHVFDGRVVFPAMGYLYFVIKQFSLIHGYRESFRKAVVFRNIKLMRAIIAEEGFFKFTIRIDSFTGKFIVSSQGVECVKGFIGFGKMNEKIFLTEKPNSDELLNSEAIYKELKIRCYDYGTDFKGLIEADFHGNHAKVKPTTHLISYLDSIIQLKILNQKIREPFLPTRIRYMFLDLNIIYKNMQNQKVVNVYYDDVCDEVYSDGIFINNLYFIQNIRKIDPSIYLYSYSFVPLFKNFDLTDPTRQKASEYISICVSLVQSLKNKNFLLNSNNREEIEKFNGNQYSFLNALLRVLEEKNSMETFLRAVEEQKHESYPISFKREEMIEEQTHLILCSILSSRLKIMEITELEKSLETVFAYNIDIYNCICDCKLLKKSELAISSKNLFDVVIYNDISTEFIMRKDLFTKNYEFKEVTRNAHNNLLEGGFFLCNFRTKITEIETEILEVPQEESDSLLSIFENILNESSFIIIAKKTNDFGLTSILLKKEQSKIKLDLTTIEIKDDFEWLQDAKTALSDGSKQICLQSKSSQITGTIGLTNCLLREYGNERIRCIISDEERINKSLLEKELPINIIKDGNHGTMLIKSLNKQMIYSTHAHVDFPTRGDLTNYQWFESPHKLWEKLSIEEKRGKFLIKNYFSGLNFKDLMIATNRISFEPNQTTGLSNNVIGLEYSGIDENGRRVFGICERNGIATTLCEKSESFHFEVPKEWTLEEAVTVPVVYGTVYYGLIMRGKLKEKESVLIHAGSGGVGQAAIRVCISMNCEIFTSVGSEAKKRKLLKLFPQLKDENIVNSRNVSFDEKILKITNGRGVDVILNSLSGEMMFASINCLAEFGRFIEIGQFDIMEDTLLDRKHKCFVFEAVNLAKLIIEAVDYETPAAKNKLEELRNLMAKGIKNGVIKPLNTHVFDKEKIEEAFRFMATAKHFGKVVIKIRDENCNENEIKVLASPRTYFYPSKVYLIIGGLGGMALQLAYWMSQRGARKLVLTTRRGLTEVYQKYIIQMIEENGTQVAVLTNKCDDYETAQRLFIEAKCLGEIGGIFNLALHLETKLFKDITEDEFSRVWGPKVETTKLLDQISRRECNQLDYFVCFSSAITALGNEGQSSYGFANSAMEMVCKRRKSEGFHALSIQFGPVGDVGNFHEHSAKSKNEMTILGLKQQRINSCLEVIDIFLSGNQTVYGSLTPLPTMEMSSKIDSSLSRVLHILGINEELTVDDKKTLAEFGADSLMVIEIQQMMNKHFNAYFSSERIRCLTLNEILKFTQCTTPQSI